MTDLGDLNTANATCAATMQGVQYFSNNFDPVKRWNGLTTTLQDAGITGPSLAIGAPTTAAGGLSNGDHLIRYRYKDTSTGFVSNPSPALTYTVSGGNGLLTFGIGVADDIRTTSDTKVDQYVIEATRVGGGTFFQLGTAAVGATSVQLGMNDDSLAQQFNSDDAYGSSEDLETYSNGVPPLGTIVVPYRGKLWIAGDAAYELTDVTFTNNSTAITGTGFSTAWDDGAAFLLLREGDTKAYEISSVASDTAMTLSVAWTGSSGNYDAKVFKRFPNRAYYSRTFYPEQYYISVWARDFLAETSDTLTSMFGRKDGLYAFGFTNAERLIFNADPSVAAGAVISPLKGRRGNWNQRTLVEVDGELFAWDRAGMWAVGEVPRHISTPIDDTLKLSIDYAEYAKFHAGYSPESRIVMFFYVQTGDTEPKYAACFEVDTGRWFVHQFLQGMTGSQQVATEDGQVRLMLGDENGYSWYFDIQNSFDGPPPTSPTILTVGASATTTVIPVDETLPTADLGVQGCMVYNPDTGESRYCSANTASQLTVGSAFSAAPADGDTLYLGPIPFEYRTKWWTGPGQETRKNAPYLIIKLFPGTDTGRMRVYFYADFATSPSQVTSFVGEEWPDGVTVTNGLYYLEIDLDGGSGDGLLSVPVPVEWNNALQARVTSIIPDGDLRILDLQFALTKRGVASDIGT